MPGVQLSTLIHRATRRPLPPPLTGVAARGPHDLGVLERAGRQHDGTTCAAAVLVMVAALGDPALKQWLITGTLGATVPPELEGATPGQLELLADGSVERRSAALQRVLKRRATSAAAGFPWPGALGVPPWGLARTARFPGVAYRHRPLDDTSLEHLDAALDRVMAAATLGTPVPLYSGGDTRRGWSTAVPRHVVLVVGETSEGLRIWEPAAGRCVATSRAELASGHPQPALGGWAHPAWVLLPVADPLASQASGGHDGRTEREVAT